MFEIPYLNTITTIKFFENSQLNHPLIESHKLLRISCLISLLLNFCNSQLGGFYRDSQYVFRDGSMTAAISKMEHFVIIANGWKPLTIITKCSILGCCSSPRFSAGTGSEKHGWYLGIKYQELLVSKIRYMPIRYMLITLKYLHPWMGKPCWESLSPLYGCRFMIFLWQNLLNSLIAILCW